MSDAKCAVEGCSEPKVDGRGRCAKHDARWRSAKRRKAIHPTPHVMTGIALDVVFDALESASAPRRERLTAAAALPGLYELDERLRHLAHRNKADADV